MKILILYARKIFKQLGSIYYIPAHGPLTRYVKLRVAPAMPERFSRHQLQRKTLVSNPGMHHGTCVTHVPWCMSGSLTGGGGENVPGIPGVCATAILLIWQEVHGDMSSGGHYWDHYPEAQLSAQNSDCISFENPAPTGALSSNELQRLDHWWLFVQMGWRDLIKWLGTRIVMPIIFAR